MYSRRGFVRPNHRLKSREYCRAAPVLLQRLYWPYLLDIGRQGMMKIEGRLLFLQYLQ
jgi:hypothetical protein